MNARTRRVGWLVAGAIVVVLLAIGARPAATSGSSQDRLYALASQLKCLQCAGESVAGSQASIAIKMRSEIEERMSTDATDDEILGFFADRYGERVLLNPSGSGVAGLVWVIPLVAAVGGIAFVAVVFSRARRRRDELATSELDDADRDMVEAALAAELSGDDG